MSTMTGGEAVCEVLKKIGVRHVFAIPSVHNIPILDAIGRGSGIEPVIVRNEQAGTHSADAYHRATGQLGVMIASTGPGTTNTVTGLYEAAFAHSRILLITGQVDTIHYGKGKGMGHEAENQVPMLRSVIEHVASPRSTEAIVPSLRHIVSQLTRGKPGPGAVEIPIDLQYQSADITIPDIPQKTPVAPQSDAIEAAAELLENASKPVIIAGGGVISADASEALVDWAEELGAPVFTSNGGRGSISDRHPQSMGSYFTSRQYREAMADVDVVLAIGTWFKGWVGQPMPGKLIHIDIDPRKIGLTYPAAVAVVGDALAAIKAIRAAMGGSPARDSAFLHQMGSVRDRIRQRIRERIGPDHEAIMDTIRNLSPEDAILVRDMTVPAYLWGAQLFPIYAPRTTMNPVGGGIGAGLPLAIGAATATGKRTIIIQGDGGFMVHIGELSTAVQYQLPIIICVFTDGGYGVLRGIQSRTFEGRTIGVDLAVPNFAAVARGFGLKGESVNSADEFSAAFQRAVGTQGPYLIDINTSSLVPMAGSLGGRNVSFTQPAG